MRYLLIFISLFLTLVSHGQDKKIRLVQAKEIAYDADLVKAQRLLGNVILEHQGSRMYCDSAYLYEASNRFESFGHVRITDQQKLTITGDKLDYTADERIAKIYGDVVLRDGDMTLNTDYVEYHLDERRASYFGGGRIVSQANNNVLVSELGHYFAEGKVMHFKDSVILTNPEYTMYTDTLHYHNISEQAFFLGPTTIQSDANKIYCENGWYDTKNERARFGEHAHIWSKEQQLLGDSIYYDRGIGQGQAFGNVNILDTLNRIKIEGHYGQHMEANNSSFVTDSALMWQYFDNDTLLLHADTLYLKSDSLDNREIAAYHGVRIFKRDLQGVCDSLSYTESDSLIRLFQNPYVWSGDNQISGERIDLKTYDGNISELYTENMAFIISKVDSTHFNQIKGRQLYGRFSSNELRKVVINGNGESVYFAVEEEPIDSVLVQQNILGVNISTCSDISIRIEERTISTVSFITKPDNTFFPLDQVDPKRLILKEFSWNAAERPYGLDTIFTPE